MFEAIKSQRVDMRGLEIDIVLADVEALNLMAQSGELDITKLSYNALTKLTDRYQLLDAGSALGHNCGPLLVKKAGTTLPPIESCSIAIPGVNTTANLLLDFAYPTATDRHEMLFSDIEAAVIDDKVDLGLLIHENRFTYAERGLEKVMDLGENWEEKTKSPIPLGGIVVKRDLPKEIKEVVQDVVRDSVYYAMENRQTPIAYIREHAQEMDPEIMYKHIDLYVNDYSKSLGTKGRQAIAALFAHVNKDSELPADLYV
jgi:1,4-dihydroxy-6-naphthoate synthase